MKHDLNNLILEEVLPTKEQCLILYDQLKMRKHKISHSTTPEYLDHVKFVTNHPYRVWFLIKLEKKILGIFMFNSIIQLV